MAIVRTHWPRAQAVQITYRPAKAKSSDDWQVVRTIAVAEVVDDDGDGSRRDVSGADAVAESGWRAACEHFAAWYPKLPDTIERAADYRLAVLGQARDGHLVELDATARGGRLRPGMVGLEDPPGTEESDDLISVWREQAAWQREQHRDERKELVDLVNETAKQIPKLCEQMTNLVTSVTGIVGAHIQGQVSHEETLLLIETERYKWEAATKMGTAGIAAWSENRRRQQASEDDRRAAPGGRGDLKTLARWVSTQIDAVTVLRWQELGMPGWAQVVALLQSPDTPGWEQNLRELLVAFSRRPQLWVAAEPRAVAALARLYDELGIPMSAPQEEAAPET